MSESAFYRLYRRLKYPLPFRTWRRLPRPLSHKNEYWDGHVRLTPRPRTCNVLLRLDGWSPPPPSQADAEWKHRASVTIRRLGDADWAELPGVFHSAFADVQPLYSWRGPAAARASRAIMNWTRLGRDGPLLADACFVAHGRLPHDHAWRLCGAAVVVLVSPGWTGCDVDRDTIPDPADPTRRVVPHLNWVFVSRRHQRAGVATLLLGEVVSALRAAGCGVLASTFTVDNDQSMRWHWRNGFAMPPSPWAGPRAVRVDAADR